MLSTVSLLAQWYLFNVFKRPQTPAQGCRYKAQAGGHCVAGTAIAVSSCSQAERCRWMTASVSLSQDLEAATACCWTNHPGWPSGSSRKPAALGTGTGHHSDNEDFPPQHLTHTATGNQGGGRLPSFIVKTSSRRLKVQDKSR